MANTLAYGFVQLETMFAERVTSSNVAVVRDAIAQSVAEHNRQVSELLSEVVGKTVAYSVRFKQPGSGTLQPLDEFGVPLPVREGGYYDVAFPIQGGGTAWGDTRISRAKMTVEEVNDHVLNTLRRDADWMKRHIMAAILDNTTWSYVDPENGTLTIQPLANGDSVEFLRKNGTSSTDNHYLAQAGAIADGAATNPYPTIYTELSEHPVNAGADIVAYIASDLVTTTKALTDFNGVRDLDVITGSGSDVLVGSVDRGFGDELLGKVGNVWIVEWSALPSTYIIANARGAARPPLQMREYAAPELQGLFTEEHSPDGNLNEHRFIRYAGFGALNRVGALAYRIGNASYAIPSGYAAPLAV